MPVRTRRSARPRARLARLGSGAIRCWRLPVVGEDLEVLRAPNDDTGRAGIRHARALHFLGKPSLRVLGPVDRDIDRVVDLVLLLHRTMVGMGPFRRGQPELAKAFQPAIIQPDSTSEACRDWVPRAAA
jgi:hypothetical protein